MNPLELPWLAWRARAAARDGFARGAPGALFDRFGRRTGRALVLRGVPRALALWLNPVSIVRHFEFPFVLSCLPDPPGRCLDLGSPRLFALYVASRWRESAITMLNPDPRDLARTAQAARRLGLGNLACEGATARALAGREGTFDCAWSISVLEHIAGEEDDTEAVRRLYHSLRPGGRLVFTVPVDREFREERRADDPYGLRAGPAPAEGHFFQRLYDEEALRARLIAPLGREPERVRWFGETTPGRYAEYERRWRREGLRCTVDDPREIADHYREYPDWRSMAGQGVCGLMVNRD